MKSSESNTLNVELVVNTRSDGNSLSDPVMATDVICIILVNINSLSVSNPRNLLTM